MGAGATRSAPRGVEPSGVERVALAEREAILRARARAGWQFVGMLLVMAASTALVLWLIAVFLVWAIDRLGPL